MLPSLRQVTLYVGRCENLSKTDISKTETQAAIEAAEVVVQAIAMAASKGSSGARCEPKVQDPHLENSH